MPNNASQEKTPHFVTGKEATRLLGISESTLRRYAKNGKIQFIRDTTSDMSHRRYDVNSFICNQPSASKPIDTNRERYAYCRVSTRGQQDDLERQIRFIQDNYPDHKIIKDIGSGLNFKRKGLQTLLDKAIAGEIQEVVVAHIDRLARFGFDLIEQLFDKLSDAKIVVLEQEDYSPEQEVVRDVLSILHVFSAKANGLRKYKDKIRYDFSDKKVANVSKSKTKNNLK